MRVCVHGAVCVVRVCMTDAVGIQYTWCPRQARYQAGYTVSVWVTSAARVCVGQAAGGFVCAISVRSCVCTQCEEWV